MDQQELVRQIALAEAFVRGGGKLVLDSQGMMIPADTKERANGLIVPASARRSNPYYGQSPVASFYSQWKTAEASQQFFQEYMGTFEPDVEGTRQKIRGVKGPQVTAWAIDEAIDCETMAKAMEELKAQESKFFDPLLGTPHDPPKPQNWILEGYQLWLIGIGKLGLVHESNRPQKPGWKKMRGRTASSPGQAGIVTVIPPNSTAPATTSVKMGVDWASGRAFSALTLLGKSTMTSLIP